MICVLGIILSAVFHPSYTTDATAIVLFLFLAPEFERGIPLREGRDVHVMLGEARQLASSLF